VEKLINRRRRERRRGGPAIVAVEKIKPITDPFRLVGLLTSYVVNGFRCARADDDLYRAHGH